nr:immunoglobulin light chain junction region [Macaca mulatta]MOW11685.1 immunoglobulin light chain junction region [Macaca mulatta]
YQQYDALPPYSF